MCEKLLFYIQSYAWELFWEHFFCYCIIWNREKIEIKVNRIIGKMIQSKTGKCAWKVKGTESPRLDYAAGLPSLNLNELKGGISPNDCHPH